MAELQLVIQDEALLKAVTFNYEELKADLTKSLEKYTSLVVEESAIKDAKADRANLNKLDKALGDKDTEIYNRILGQAHTRISELRGMVKSASLGIDKQVKSFEQKVKDDKKAEIKVIYDNNIGDLEILLPFEKVFNEKMLNVTSSMVSIEQEVLRKIITVRKDIDVIDTLKSDFALQIKDVYLRTLDLSLALSEKARLEKVQADIAAIAAKPVANLLSNKVTCPAVELTKEQIIKPEDMVYEIPTRRVEFFVVATNEQLLKIREFLVQNQIEFGGINNAK